MALEGLETINSQVESIFQAHPWLYGVMIAVLVWKLIWYGLALYSSVKKDQKSWFVALFVCAFVLNDLGILAIVYLILNRKKKAEKPAKAAK